MILSAFLPLFFCFRKKGSEGAANYCYAVFLKNLFFTSLILAMLVISGCGPTEAELYPEKFQEKSAEPAPPVEEKKPLASDKYILADDNFSNLQLEEFDKPVYDKYGIWERQAKGLPMAMPKLVPYEKESIAYLTFDDGPDDKVTPQILDTLKQENVKATFFFLGNAVEKYPDVLKRTFEEGHQVANHSYNHNYRQLYSSPWNFIEQFIHTDEIIRSKIGVRPLVIRAPGGVAGVFNDNYWNMVESMGYVEFDWNISTDDATPSKPNASQQINNVLKQLGSQPPKTLLILMHSTEAKTETAKALPELIHLLRDWGYKFGVVTPMTPQLWE